jgi:hypothetical protein
MKNDDLFRKRSTRSHMFRDDRRQKKKANFLTSYVYEPSHLLHNYTIPTSRI